MINEFAQWAVLVVLVVFVFGLTRQLGIFLRPPEEHRGASYGPDLGELLPSGLFDNNAKEMADSLGDSSKLAVAVVHRNCEPCEYWVDAFLRTSLDLPSIALTADQDPAYVSKLQEAFDLVVPDDPKEKHLQEAGLSATPFLMLLDSSLRIEEKQLGGDPIAAISRWTNSQTTPVSTLEVIS